jgi:hypothetical protein
MPKIAGRIARREFLRVGGLGAAGLSLPGLLGARAGQSKSPIPAERGRAKSCILLFMGGGPPQQHTFDLKPDMPVEVRGGSKPIDTNVPGIRISEALPLLAKHADKFTIIRSVTDPYVGGAHGQSVYQALTGHTSARVKGDDIPPRAEDYPCIASTVAHLRTAAHPVPPAVWLLDMHRRTFAGEGGGFLGKKRDPFRILRDPNKANFEVPTLALTKDFAPERMAERRGLLERMDRGAERFLESHPAGIKDHRELAMKLLTSPQSRKAFDIGSETVAMRDRYGRHKFGQGALLARRLVEHGVPLVTVYWTGEDDVSQGWDLHYEIDKRLKPLMPPLDAGFSALLADLSELGLLDETLVVWMGEFGRAPLIEPGGGRGHWGRCSSVVMAGGGIRGGRVYGSSDRRAAEPSERPVTMADVVTTIYHCLGIGMDTELPDGTGRSVRLCQGEVIRGLL